MRLSLTLPRAAINEAMFQVNELAPGAEVGQLVEVPAEPTDAWREMIHGGAMQGSVATIQGQPQKHAIGQLLCESNVVLGLDAPDQPRLFDEIGALAAREHGFSAQAVAAALAAREALGSTGLGQGVAIPHGRMASIPQASAFYVRLLKPISFNAPDEKPVSDIVVLLFPDWSIHAHLHVLASVAQCFCDRNFRTLLQSCSDAKAVCTLFSVSGDSKEPVWR